MNLLATFDACYVFPMIEKDRVKKLKDFDRVCVGSKKLLLLKESPVCVKCGCEGTIFHLEENENGKRILNLFTVKGDKEVMMTIDHLEKGNKLDKEKTERLLRSKLESNKLGKWEARRLFRSKKIYRLLGKDNMKKLGEIIWGEYHGDNSNISS